MENEANKMQFRPIVVAFSLLIALTLLVSAVPQGLVAAQDNCKARHTVVAGDTISYVANLYQVTVEEIAKENNIQPPYVITVGTVLCIPSGTDTSTGTTTEGANRRTGNTPTMVVTPSFTRIHIDVQNFVKNTPYYVSIRDRSGLYSPRIGNFTTDKNGDFADWFRVPADVYYSLDMQVCVKNTWTDAVSCVGFSNVEPFIDQIIRARCTKEGR